MLFRSVSAKYLLSLLNSRVIQVYLEAVAETSGMGTNRWINNHVKKFPIPKIDQSKQKPFISIVNKILVITKNDDYLTSSTKQAKVEEYKRQIDEMVYKLYDLTDEEIQIVEDFKQ